MQTLIDGHNTAIQKTSLLCNTVKLLEQQNKLSAHDRLRFLKNDFPQVGEAENIKTVQFTWWDDSTLQSSPDDLERCWFPVYLDSWSVFTQPLVQDGSKVDKHSLKKRLKQGVIVFSFDILVVNFICQLDRTSGWLSGSISGAWLKGKVFPQKWVMLSDECPRHWVEKKQNS